MTRMVSAFENPRYNPEEKGFPWGAVAGLVILGGIAAVVVWKWDTIASAVSKYGGENKTTVTLKIIDSATEPATPVVGATVKLGDIDSSITDNDGIAKFRGVPIIADRTKGGYVVKVYDAQGNDLITNRSIMVTPETTEPFTQTISLSGYISTKKPGVVPTEFSEIDLTLLDKNEKPVVGYTVNLRRKNDGVVLGTATTQNDGTVKFLNVPVEVFENGVSISGIVYYTLEVVDATGKTIITADYRVVDLDPVIITLHIS